MRISLICLISLSLSEIFCCRLVICSLILESPISCSLFSKIPNFNPEVFIFYVGINDTLVTDVEKFDIPWRETKYEKIRDYIYSSSILWEILKKIKFKYFLEVKLQYDVTKIEKGLYENYKYINYNKAKTIYLNKIDEDGIIDQLTNRINKLNEFIVKNEIKPIFITQVQYNGISPKNLYFVNEYIKKFCLENNYTIIKLDELIENLGENYFYDELHTSVSGSAKIADIIYPEIKKNLINFTNK